MDESFIVSIAPHIKDKSSTDRIMRLVGVALIPAGASGVFIFGLRSFFVIISAVLAAVITEAVIAKMRKKRSTISDGSAILTGLLLAYSLSPMVPLWLPAIGSFFAIAIGKQVFGGLGHNIFNPALVGRAFLMVSWPAYMTTWQNPKWVPDAVSTATPLAIIKGTHGPLSISHNYLELFLGNRPGCIGEVCIAALLIGAIFLFIKRLITWHIPVSYVATVAVLSWAFNGRGPFGAPPLFFVVSGGLILGAFFMATDYVTSPLSSRGKLIFGFGCGILTFIIRKFAGYPEGVSYAILIMNAAVPIIDRHTFPKWFGAVRRLG